MESFPKDKFEYGEAKIVGGVKVSEVMIKNVLERRKESNTYLATDSRHPRSPQIVDHIFYHFTFPGFPFILMVSGVRSCVGWGT